MSSRPWSLVFIAMVAACGSAGAAIVPQEPSRFDRVALQDPSTRIGTLAEPPEALPGFDEARAAWDSFRAAHGGFKVHVDRRTGTPLLVEGAGIPWLSPELASAASPRELEARARSFVAENSRLFRVAESELGFNAEGSGQIDANHWVLVFDRRVGGVPVEGGRFTLYVTRGNLVAFGAERWGAIEGVPEVRVDADAARGILHGYMGLRPSEPIEELEGGTLVLVPVPAGAEAAGRYTGPVGRGVRHHLAWRFVLRVAGERGTWVGKVDAVTGEVLALYDDVKYATVKGGVFPRSDDGACFDGCEQADYPMPYTDVTVDGSPGTAGDMGSFDCEPGGSTATTALVGPYVRISDNCGAVNENVVCDEDLDLQQSAGTDCAVPAGDSPGNTHSARTNAYHLNRIKEKGRYWLPSNTWLQGQLIANVNINSTCNAYWDGTVNFYKSGGGCRNTGEIGGVIHHEYGHGIDQNDGGGYDNPSEAYADVVAILQEHRSCVGRGFFMSGTCSGYGDACLECTGIRDMDWDKRQSHTPATPQNFTDPNCGGGGGPCGREVHCESYVPSEAIFDLAVRDLPASGLDADSSWQLAEKLFYKSRQGSGGSAFNCALPNSDGCNASSWFTKLRNADDDDGNLNNGTPHAAAIFAAFNRHRIACGAANDPSNQSSSSCPSLQRSVLGVTAGSNSASLSWTAVSGAANYLVLRNEVDCDYTSNVIATVAAPTTAYTDADLPNDFPIHYRVQAQGSNPACDSPVSECETTTPQPFAGSIKLDRALYGCSSLITITVRDANVGAATTTATLSSNSEPAPETVVLSETSPGSAKFVGTITTTSASAMSGDGLLSVTHGDLITATYVDADDGQGGTNLTRQTTATADCVYPLISQVQTSGVSDVQATVTWITDELSSSIVHWGELRPPTNTTANTALVTAHAVTLGGLQPCTVYYYSVESRDRAGNVALDDAGGDYHHFETLGDLGSGLQACHAGRITINESAVSCSSPLNVKLADLDVNLSPTSVDTVVVDVTSTSETLPEQLLLAETGPNTSQFAGVIATAPVPVVEGDGVLQSAHGDVLTATYHDVDDGAGAAAVSFDTAVADCAGALISGIRVTSVTDESARVDWSTSEPTTGKVHWGATPGLGNLAVDGVLRTSHSLLLSPVVECGRVYFRVESTDAYGHVVTADDNGSPFEFNAYQIGGAIFKDGFETPTGWSLQGEWEIAGPQGKGTPPADPTQAFAGSKVLGVDLTGQGAHPGDYEPGASWRATSPSIDTTGFTNVELKFRRWLNVGGDASALIFVQRDSFVFPPFWSTSNASEASWSLQTLGLSGAADNASSVRIIFEQRGGSGPGTRSGWNLDRVVLRTAASPEFDVCGGCGGAPTFAGLQSAADANPCGDTGVTLLWNAAPAWGTGHAGSYSIYRDTTPNFAPSAANRIATGVTGTNYSDATAPNDVTLHYLVRAENDETCSAGPANGGVTDSNVVYRSALDETSQPPASAIEDSLRATPVNDAHVRLSWSPAAGASRYHVYRAQAPQGPFGQIADVSPTLHDDLNQMGNTTSWYYLVRPVDACGNESP
jgi:hypothetical protein